MTKITIDRAVVEQALEALELAQRQLGVVWSTPDAVIDEAITALKAALAAPPAAWAYKDSGRICDNKDGRLTAPEGWRPLYD